MATFRLELTAASKRNLSTLVERTKPDRLARMFDRFFDAESAKAAGHVTGTMLSSQRLRRRTGALARSIVGAAVRVRGVPGMKVGVFRGPGKSSLGSSGKRRESLPYAAVQEFGTVGKGGRYPTIVPRRAKALAVPTGPALTPAGVPRYTGPREYPRELVFIPFRGPNAIGGLFEKPRGRRRRRDVRSMRLAYFLLRRTDIAPTHFLRDGFRAYLPTVTKNLGAFLREQLTGKPKGGA